MGEVWAARCEQRREDVAIKVLRPKAAIEPELVQRFVREARVAASIQSPYVCRLLAHERDEHGTHLLVFERLRGESLAERLERETYLPFAELGPIIDDVCQGLSAAHAAGVVHRDLKPGNIFLEWTGEPGRPERAKVLDFGISKLRRKDPGSDEPSFTDFDATLGSCAYMAPEQVRGSARVDARADIYALGAVAFRALSGRLPFVAANAAMVMALKVDRPAPTLLEVTYERWPAGLERFVGKALQRDREARFGSALEALEAWRALQPEAALMQRPPPGPSGRRPQPFVDSGDTAVDTLIDGAPTRTEVSAGGWAASCESEDRAVTGPSARGLGSSVDDSEAPGHGPSSAGDGADPSVESQTWPGRRVDVSGNGFDSSA